jgi:hypothetical protein
VTASSATAPPLLLLDVDGVLNALSDDGPTLAVWPHWQDGWARAEGRRYPIRWAPEVVARLRSWHEQGRLELQWLTTWGHDANRELRSLLALPELAVAGTYEEADLAAGAPEEQALQHDTRAAHAAVAPAAPDTLSGRWWKYDIVRRLREQQPDRTLLWVDDELHHPANPFTLWAAENGVVTVGPDPRTGLTGTDLDVLAAATASGPGPSAVSNPAG